MTCSAPCASRSAGKGRSVVFHRSRRQGRAELRRHGRRAGRRARGGQERDRRGQQDRVHAVRVRRRARQLQLQRLRLLGVGQLRAARRRPAVLARGLEPARVLRQLRTTASGSRSGPTPATPTCRSPDCSSTRAARAAATADRWSRTNSSGHERLRRPSPQRVLSHPPGSDVLIRGLTLS